MKTILYIIAVSLFLSFGVFAQEATTPEVAKVAKPRKPTFRATKEQVMQAQKMLKMTETGKNNPETKTAIKKFQADNGIKTNGSLNRDTLEKMGIALTDKQKAMPIVMAKVKKEKTDSDSTTTKIKKKAPFRASKDQIMMVQKMLKVEEVGKLNTTTRDAIKKYQEENSIKITGTLNKETLMKMGVELTDKQKEY
jgi:peptidoglycan hydrolase-like protein with peptidoglycan-binding domain